MRSKKRVTPDKQAEGTFALMEDNVLMSQAIARLNQLADDLAKRSAKLAVEIADERIGGMAEEDLDEAKKAALKKREKELATAEKAVKAREQKVARDERDLDAREKILEASLKKLRADIKKEEAKLEHAMKERAAAQEMNRQIVIHHQDMVSDLQLAFDRVKELEARFGALEEKAEDFVDQAMLDYFDLSSDDRE